MFDERKEKEKKEKKEKEKEKEKKEKKKADSKDRLYRLETTAGLRTSRVGL